MGNDFFEENKKYGAKIAKFANSEFRSLMGAFLD
jgi:hypothetical protein